jgi:LytS/YehU family sensor histidine kinase
MGILAVVLLVLAFPLFLLSKIVASIIRAFSSRAEVSEKAAEQSDLARQLTEAKLAALQAQIEPHFLFNTLASVRQLILTDPEAAAKMQADLIKYLRAAIPQMRESTTTLAREAELSRAYLDILKVRMENRLSWTIDIPPALGAAGFPPMMLPTLVENAIKHGLEPLTQGGEIRISATAAGGKLRVSVADTGVGFADEPGGGVGLANVRERLASLYGKQAQLIVEPNWPRGAKMTIEIPYAGSATR